MGPVAAAAGALARLDAGKTFVDIRDEAETTHLAIGDDIDAAFGLLANHFGDRACDAARIGLSVERLASLLGLDHLQQIGRPRQAADMGGENTLRASFHLASPVRFDSVAQRADQVSTVRSAEIDDMKK